MRQHIHNHANLHEYDLLTRGRNEYIRNAFLIAPGSIQVIADKAILQYKDDICLCEYDYSIFDTKTDCFGIKNVRRIELKEKDDSYFIEFVEFEEAKNYVLKIANSLVTVFLTPDIGGMIDTHFDASEENNFGVRLHNNKAVFKIWSPPAGRIELLLFHPDGSPVQSSSPIELTYTNKGVWTTELNALSDSGFEGMQYQYCVYAYGEKYIAPDPYSFSMAAFHPADKDNIGRSAIVKMDSPLAKPENFRKTFSNRKAMASKNDLIAWELHVRDCTSEPGTVPPEMCGTYLGCIERIPYMKDLGITHVQLMPVMKFYTVNESDRSFSGRNAQRINYNWGYDPMHFFSPEGWYSSEPADPYSRIRELRMLIKSLHDNGIGVILDVVYNHTHIVETFENIAPGCYYRFDDNLKISGLTGAGPTIESRRRMVRKLIVDSLLHFIREYHVDGFRFDLMNFLDHDTMVMISETAGKAYDPETPESLILQGEAWMFSELNLSEKATGKDAATTKLNYPVKLITSGIFNDTARDAFSGNHGYPGFAAGNTEMLPKAAAAVAGGVRNFNPGAVPFHHAGFFDPYALFACSAANCINFLSVHDGFTLWDKMNLSMKGADHEEKLHAMRMAALMLFTSAGKIILHAGDEILRSKPVSVHDSEKHRTMTAEGVVPFDGIEFFHENSYCSADFTNMIRWSHAVNNKDAQEMLEYFKGLIKMRRSFPAFRSEPAGQGGSNLQFITTQKYIREEMPSLYGSFKDENLKALTIRFINGPGSITLYMVGEVHPEGQPDNPADNPFKVQFDHNGIGEITFHREQIRGFDTDKWGNVRQLDFKLVTEKGTWKIPEGAYSETGNNSIDIRMINRTGVVTIDLSVQDYRLEPRQYENDAFLAYSMDNDMHQPAAPGFINAPFNKIIVIHNPSEFDIEVPVPEIDHPCNWQVFCDAFASGITPLQFSSVRQRGKTMVKIMEGKVCVPGKNAAVVVGK